jgi:hypothetical protein
MADDDRPKGIFCLRNQKTKCAEEHLGCPYCFGRTRTAVEGGDPKQFCDWDAEQDPVAFGFPPGTIRNSGG